MNPAFILYSLGVIAVNSSDKMTGWEEVERLRGEKPVLVVGIPQVSGIFGHPIGDVNIDVNPRLVDSCPGGVLADIRSIPYGYKHFSVAFVSHVIEHLPTVEDAEDAIAELWRVADHVIIISPHVFDVVNFIHPGHYLIVEPAGVCVDGEITVRPRSRR